MTGMPHISIVATLAVGWASIFLLTLHLSHITPLRLYRFPNNLNLLCFLSHWLMLVLLFIPFNNHTAGQVQSALISFASLSGAAWMLIVLYVLRSSALERVSRSRLFKRQLAYNLICWVYAGVALILTGVQPAVPQGIYWWVAPQSALRTVLLVLNAALWLVCGTLGISLVFHFRKRGPVWTNTLIGYSGRAGLVAGLCAIVGLLWGVYFLVLLALDYTTQLTLPDKYSLWLNLVPGLNTFAAVGLVFCGSWRTVLVGDKKEMEESGPDGTPRITAESPVFAFRGRTSHQKMTALFQGRLRKRSQRKLTQRMVVWTQRRFILYPGFLVWTTDSGDKTLGVVPIEAVRWCGLVPNAHGGCQFDVVVEQGYHQRYAFHLLAASQELAATWVKAVRHCMALFSDLEPKFDTTRRYWKRVEEMLELGHGSSPPWKRKNRVDHIRIRSWQKELAITHLVDWEERHSQVNSPPSVFSPYHSEGEEGQAEDPREVEEEEEEEDEADEIDNAANMAILWDGLSTYEEVLANPSARLHFEIYLQSINLAPAHLEFPDIVTLFDGNPTPAHALELYQKYISHSHANEATRLVTKVRTRYRVKFAIEGGIEPHGCFTEVVSDLKELLQSDMVFASFLASQEFHEYLAKAAQERQRKWKQSMASTLVRSLHLQLLAVRNISIEDEVPPVCMLSMGPYQVSMRCVASENQDEFKFKGADHWFSLSRAGSYLELRLVAAGGSYIGGCRLHLDVLPSPLRGVGRPWQQEVKLRDSRGQGKGEIEVKLTLSTRTRFTVKAPRATRRVSVIDANQAEAVGLGLDLAYITPRIICSAYPNGGPIIVDRSRPSHQWMTSPVVSPTGSQRMTSAVYYPPSAHGMDASLMSPINIPLGPGALWNDTLRLCNWLTLKHGNRFAVFNTCKEAKYQYVQLGHLENIPVHNYPLDPSELPSLDLVARFCRDVKEYLAADARNVVFVHCDSGRGRSGLMICLLLLNYGLAPTMHDAIRRLVRKRNRQLFEYCGPDRSHVFFVTPSQLRWMESYARYELLLRPSITDRLLGLRKQLWLQCVSLHTCPRDSMPDEVSSDDSQQNVHYSLRLEYQRVTEAGQIVSEVVDSRRLNVPCFSYSTTNTVRFILHENKLGPLAGDFRLLVYQPTKHGDICLACLVINLDVVNSQNKVPMGQFEAGPLSNRDQTNTSLKEQTVHLVFEKHELDGPHNDLLDQRCPALFSIELRFLRCFVSMGQGRAMPAAHAGPFVIPEEVTDAKDKKTAEKPKPKPHPLLSAEPATTVTNVNSAASSDVTVKDVTVKDVAVKRNGSARSVTTPIKPSEGQVQVHRTRPRSESPVSRTLSSSAQDRTFSARDAAETEPSHRSPSCISVSSLSSASSLSRLHQPSNASEKKENSFAGLARGVLAIVRLGSVLRDRPSSERTLSKSERNLYRNNVEAQRATSVRALQDHKAENNNSRPASSSSLPSSSSFPSSSSARQHSASSGAYNNSLPASSSSSSLPPSSSSSSFLPSSSSARQHSVSSGAYRQDHRGGSLSHLSESQRARLTRSNPSSFNRLVKVGQRRQNSPDDTTQSYPDPPQKYSRSLSDDQSSANGSATDSFSQGEFERAIDSRWPTRELPHLSSPVAGGESSVPFPASPNTSGRQTYTTSHSSPTSPTRRRSPTENEKGRKISPATPGSDNEYNYWTTSSHDHNHPLARAHSMSRTDVTSENKRPRHASFSSVAAQYHPLFTKAQTTTDPALTVRPAEEAGPPGFPRSTSLPARRRISPPAKSIHETADGPSGPPAVPRAMSRDSDQLAVRSGPLGPARLFSREAGSEPLSAPSTSLSDLSPAMLSQSLSQISDGKLTPENSQASSIVDPVTSSRRGDSKSRQSDSEETPLNLSSPEQSQMEEAGDDSQSSSHSMPGYVSHSTSRRGSIPVNMPHYDTGKGD
eukprot:g22283.t1